MAPVKTSRARRAALLTIPVLLALASACANDTTTTAGGGSPASSSTSTTSSSSSTGSSGSTATAKKVSANTASEEEIKAALTAAGVANAAKWTDEVMEYRPYDTNDPSLSKLKKELAKYKPDQETLQKILSVLEP